MLTLNLTCSLQNVMLGTKAVIEDFEEIVANKSILTEFYGETPHRARGGHVSHSNFCTQNTSWQLNSRTQNTDGTDLMS